MQRREFITFLCGMALASAFASWAQPAPVVAIVGVLSPFPAATAAPWHKAFPEGLQELGWIEGKNIRIEYRYAEGRAALLPELAADLVRQRVNVIVTSVNTDTLVMKNVTQTIPIVMASAVIQLVGSLKKPRTARRQYHGFVPDRSGLSGKRLQVLKEFVHVSPA